MVELKKLITDSIAELKSVNDRTQLESLRIKVSGKKGYDNA